MRLPSRSNGVTPEVRPFAKLYHIGVRLVELLIALYAAALGLILLTGGMDLGPITARDAAKPLLILAITIPLRLTLVPPPWTSLRSSRAGATAVRAWASLTAAPLGRAILDVAFVLMVTQFAVFAVAFLANLVYPPARPRYVDLPFERAKFAETFAAWDSGWYFDIAKRGYFYAADGQSSIAFLPLYPMLVRAAAWPFGGTDGTLWVAAILVSCSAFALALVALHRFTERVLGSREAARRTILYLAVFPFSFFMTRVYTESLFLLTTVMAVSAAYSGRWPQAGFWGALAAITRPNGILVGVPLVLLAGAGYPPLKELCRRLVWLVPVPGGLVAFSAFVYTLSGDPLAWLSAQSQWGYFLWNAPWRQLLKMLERLVKYGFYDYFFVSKMAPFHLINGLTALAVLALTPAVFKRLGTAMGAYVLISLLVPLSSNSLVGIGRYTAVLFPLFMLLGTVQSPRLHEALLVTVSLFLALFVTFFVTLRPIF